MRLRFIAIVGITVIGIVVVMSIPYDANLTIVAKSRYVAVRVREEEIAFGPLKAKLTSGCVRSATSTRDIQALSIKGALLVIHASGDTLRIVLRNISRKEGLRFSAHNQDGTVQAFVVEDCFFVDLNPATRNTPASVSLPVAVGMPLADVTSIGRGLTGPGVSADQSIIDGVFTLSSNTVFDLGSFVVASGTLLPGDHIEFDRAAASRGTLHITMGKAPIVVVRQRAEGVRILRFGAEVQVPRVSLFNRLWSDPIIFALWTIAVFVGGLIGTRGGKS